MELNFTTCHTYTRALFLAMDVCYDESKARSFAEKYISDIERLKIIETAEDKALLIETKCYNYLGIAGTFGTVQDWWNNFNFLTTHGFHRGIYLSATRFFPMVQDAVKTNGKPILIGGHSQGDPMALLLNYLFKMAGYGRRIESVGFSGPYVASKKFGITELKRNHVCHTHIFCDKDKSLISDPTNNVGGWQCKHYGTQINLGGSAGPFDHAYSQVLLRLEQKYHQWKKHDDAAYLSGMMEVAKK